MDRKNFLRRSVGLASAMACLDLSACTGLPYATYTVEEKDLVVHKDQMIDSKHVLLAVDDLPAPVLIRLHDDASYSAVLLRCTHRGCTVRPHGEILQCPCHGSQYKYSGERLKGPAPKGLTRYTVTSDDSTIRVNLLEVAS